MRIAVTKFVSLDGVSQGPGSPTEDTSGGFTQGGWLVPCLDEVFVQRPSGSISPTLADGTWQPTTVLRGDLARAVRDLKAHPGRELQVHGCARLGNTLLAAGLVDTLRLAVAPAVLGSGRRLLTHPASATGLRLVRHEVTARGLLLIEYLTVGAVPVGEYDGVAGR